MLTVVIPSFNEQTHIGACLQSLVNQKAAPQFNVIVCDNNSTDRTVELVQSYSKHLNLTIVNEPVKGRGSARATGFAAAKSDLIFSTDADTVVPRDWITSLLPFFDNPSVIAVTGTGKIVGCSPFVNRVVTMLQPVSMHGYRMLYGHYWLSGFNFAIRKSAYEKSGGFNRTLNSIEDIDLSMRVHKLGRIRFTPDTPVIMSGRRFNNGILSGGLSYFSTFYRYRYTKNPNVVMSDIR